MYSKIIVILCLVLSLFHYSSSSQVMQQATSNAAAIPFEDDQVSIPGPGPDWAATVQENIRLSEYYVTWQDRTYLSGVTAAYQAPNRAQNFRSYFTSQGIRLIPRLYEKMTPPWEWGLMLIGYGFVDAVQPVAAATLKNQGNRIEYSRYDYSISGNHPITEWYINSEKGLEQGFTLYTPPLSIDGKRTGAMTVLELGLSGNLTPHLLSDESAIEFTTSEGMRSLRYGALLVTGANNQQLPAYFSLSNGGQKQGEGAIYISFDAASATYPITVRLAITNLTAAVPDWKAELNQDGAQFGISVSTAGDVNGDGYSDVVVGAENYDHGQTNEGAVFVFHGGKPGLKSTPDWSAESDQENSSFGHSVGIAGDVNNDGYADLIVGAYYYTNDIAHEGRAYVYHGSSSGLSLTANWIAEGDAYCVFFGWSVDTAGDVNGDGYSDVIVGATGYDHGQTDEGRAVVYHGGPGGLSTTLNWAVESNNEGAELGASVSTAGDVNGDGYSDVIIGAPNFTHDQSQEGVAVAYYGGPAGLPTTQSWYAERDQAEACFGHSVSTAGDVNGDGYSDVIVGAPFYEYSLTNGGAVYVYEGSSSGLSSPGASWSDYLDGVNDYFGYSVSVAGDVNGDGYSDVIVGSPGCLSHDEGCAIVYFGGSDGLYYNNKWQIDGDQTNAGFGKSVNTAGDVNGDGLSDLIVGAPEYDHGQTNEGLAFVFHGKLQILETTGLILERNQSFSGFGSSVGTAGDVNGDGFADVIVGAPRYDDGQTDEGAAFIFHGGEDGLSDSPSATIQGNQDYAYFGISVSTAGDVNGDGYSDVVVGASGYDHDQTDEGGAFVYHGSSTGISGLSWSAEINQISAGFGRSVGTAGDVNGDGYSDLVVGAWGYDHGQVDEGGVFVYYGSSTGLSPVSNWSAEVDQGSAHFGCSVGTAGDVNRDGYSDIIVGASDYDHEQANEGGAFVYYGSSIGLSDAPDWMAESNQITASFGQSVGTAGDMNGDGYSDVIVGAPNYDHPESNEGSAFVYHGGASGLSDAPDWSAEIDEVSALFGSSVGTAGDVNGDGYADVIIGAYLSDPNPSTPNNGDAALYLGGASGVYSRYTGYSLTPADSYAHFGWSVSAAGDVNGDGYADLVVGGPDADFGYTDQGVAFVTYGYAKGLPMIPRQMDTFVMGPTHPIALLGKSDSRSGFQVRLMGRMPLGREMVRLEWQASPLGVLFGNPATYSGVTTWYDTDVGGFNIMKIIYDLPPSMMPYHWRARIQYCPGNRLGQTASRWFHIPWNGWNESDLRLLDPLLFYLPVISKH